jgi:trans-aconitate 2-methyltransferase
VNRRPALTRDWDGSRYDAVSGPQARWGATVLERLPLAGDERVLDAGCGSGRVTEQLLARLPRGSVVALDASPSMLAEARSRLARFGDRVAFVQADLARPLPVVGLVDAVLSTATFHWVLDRDALFANLAAVLRPGGRLVAQCGGAGNVQRLTNLLATLGYARGNYMFATPDETRRRLERAGFEQIDCWLSDEPTRFEPGESFEAFLETVCLRGVVDGMPPDQRPAFVRYIAERLGEPVLDYVRLNIVARRT